MADYCRWVAGKLGLSDEAINDLVILAMLHDIGKMGINRNILNKPGALSVRERREIEQHPEIGYRITRNIPELSQVSQYILAHHERWDGTGYPNRLRGEEIPLASRIIAVVDAYDVMTSGRVYRPARNAEEALDELKQCAGTQFDPEIVDIFTELIAEKVLHANSTEIKEKAPGSRADGHSSEENGRPSSEKE
jgi:HD-GYP domain-containing protein (c-di-GMP phosphodiesterase class II)